MSAIDNGGRRAALHAFGHLLKRLRNANDLTQEELAERACVSVRLISDLERGSSHLPRRDTVQLLADGLHLRGSERDNFIALARGRPFVAEADADSAALRLVLPHPPTPIVGRLKETAAATGLLLDPDLRLLTLTGLGGVGKTRLALEVAHKTAGALRDGAVFVDLAPVRDPELVLTAMAHALEVQPSPERPLRQEVIDFLQPKSLLLVLDNFEQVMDAATTVADLLAACPGLKVLATSRMPLHIRAEYEYPVGPLATPDLDDLPPLNELAQVPAIQLLVRRAEAVNHQFALTDANARDVAELTLRLDGLPLAIELAATRLRVLAPADLLARLERRLPLLTGGARDLPARQQAIRATLDWSHDLLSSGEQTLLRRLAVFAGGCSVDAAEWVADHGLQVTGDGLQGTGTAGDGRTTIPQPATRNPQPTTLDHLGGLVEKSLLRARDTQGDGQRFSMLETIREYGLERLEVAGEETEIRQRHLIWCLDLAERAEPELTGAEQQRWFAKLDIEHDNLRTALGWAIARGDAEIAMRLGGALHRFWATQGHYEEGRRWLDSALAIDSGEPSAARGYALNGAGVLAWFLGDFDRAEALWQESLSLFQALGDRTRIAYAFGNLGLIGDAREDYKQATASYEQALALFRELGDQTYISFMLGNLGLIAYFQKDYPRATTLIEEALAMSRALGDRNSIAMTLGNLGLVAFAQGDYERATALHEEALSLGWHSTNRPWLARGIENFALIAAATGDPARAVRLFGAAAALRARLGASLTSNDRAVNQRYIGEASERLGDDAFAQAWDEGEAMPLDEAIAYALRYDPPRQLTKPRSI
jgi:predicted ATPase